ncbi:hypothetical protein HPB52_003554 [Rhipicephalus sanguineus]|uniref:THAP-type domain-containing protein n=1 Tax=Rhipicephalus sanguineus TaxID=34632 RepID=A0A9D4T8H5_RHISA|nr:hypothetical protein HPB52_003554 [Rhipicephalus sanguineus]
MPKAFCAIFTYPSKRGSGESMHRFPCDEPRRQKWIDFVRACGLQDWSPVQNSRVCGLHFEAHCYMPKTLDWRTWVFRHDLVHCSVSCCTKHSSRQQMPGS